ncbi:ADP-ribosylation factor-like protein isoform X2 [Tanacetum coccineum]
MKATYTTRHGYKHNTKDVCHPFGSDGSFRKWPIMAAYNKDTVKMTIVSRTFGSDRAITAAYEKDEGIDELAEFCGAGKVVAEWTTRLAMFFSLGTTVSRALPNCLLHSDGQAAIASYTAVHLCITVDKKDVVVNKPEVNTTCRARSAVANVNQVDILGVHPTDVGGQEKLRPLWRHYFNETNGLAKVYNLAGDEYKELSCESIKEWIQVIVFMINYYIRGIKQVTALGSSFLNCEEEAAIRR